MAYITAVGLKGTIRYFKDIDRAGINFPRKATYDMCIKLKDRVRTEIQALGHNKEKNVGHNTSTPLMSYLRGPSQAGKKGYKVFMAKEPEGTTLNLPLIVEKGARPHAVVRDTMYYGKRTPIVIGLHPGFIGRRYWEKGITAFLTTDFEGELKKSAKNLIRGNAR